MAVPAGKTVATLKSDIKGTDFKAQEQGYIDGYAFNVKMKPFAVFVRTSDGEFTLTEINNLTSVTIL